MIDGSRCYAAMSELEKTRWRKETGIGSYSKFCMDRQYDTFEDFIKASFLWSGTKLGHDYWEFVSKRYVLHDILSPVKNFNHDKPRKPFT